MDWNDPEQRLALAEAVGVEEYNRLFDEYRKTITITTVNGYAIRPINTMRFGPLFAVADSAFFTLQEAEAYARTLEAKQ